ncbi:undecaprenyldiphospho-muramoylpentapeptide beta-N-acetylglucosaminyltransferase [Cytophagales bacterium LB-30]|uniref:UDP-N-acetylglucosamine--N-acetylmuramyl-(pentapeptide) pyrophosphoryl-undecaprenol N-acetylglucosamine transferase n=1 Tax=Shiella aurantiaca TaxID=3058365 RepID=A0ABT8F1W8_9BACT|nr:undecaprenyldiphospho-muramoylpentapeptide beta-N-acetylglucosaminyltransferase [Shiella aurantiaca]MDN4164425.1 undecaprenyldiphospho-muramoylpentapeptide beta-N-acetylglucosaminyltransferase [Shiella aurantiaca]
MEKQQPYRIIISGGGTGGHVYPAIAIANHFKDRFPDAEILFVGAKGRMEMQKVPEAGYEIIGLWISGIQRSLTLANLSFPFKLISSLWKARQIIRQFKPHAVVGVGGYASGPLLYAAVLKGIPALIQEQNSYAGLTNKLLRNKVQSICVAHDGMERYFPKDKIVVTGNPVRKDITQVDEKLDKARKHFRLDADKKTLLVIGGSLGARTINQSILKHIEELVAAQVQLIWQTGKLYYEGIASELEFISQENIRVMEFIKDMDLAYAAADVVISRAGALSISELCLAQKPAIFVPSPNVAEDHQTKNAQALVQHHAAMMVTDAEAPERLVKEALLLLSDEERKQSFKKEISKLAKPEAANKIVDELVRIIQ